MDPPVVSVVVPTRGRAAYLEVTLDSLLEQRGGIASEILVVDDGVGPATAAAVGARPRRPLRPARAGARPERRPQHRPARGRAPLIAFVDDDVLVPPGWLEALVEGAQRNPDADAFGGPIRARLEGRPPRSCGREQPPITTLDLGDRRPRDRRRLGGELRGPPQRRRAGRAVRRVDHATARRRGGVARAAAPRRAAVSSTWRPPGSTTAAPPPTRACDRWPGPPTRAGAARGASDDRRGQRAVGWRASCACSRAAAGTR